MAAALSAGGDGGRRSPEHPLIDVIVVCRLIGRALRTAFSPCIFWTSPKCDVAHTSLAQLRVTLMVGNEHKHWEIPCSAASSWRPKDGSQQQPIGRWPLLGSSSSHSHLLL